MVTPAPARLELGARRRRPAPPARRPRRSPPPALPRTALGRPGPGSLVTTTISSGASGAALSARSARASARRPPGLDARERDLDRGPGRPARGQAHRPVAGVDQGEPARPRSARWRARAAAAVTAVSKSSPGGDAARRAAASPPCPDPRRTAAPWSGGVRAWRSGPSGRARAGRRPGSRAPARARRTRPPSAAGAPCPPACAPPGRGAPGAGRGAPPAGSRPRRPRAPARARPKGSATCGHRRRQPVVAPRRARDAPHP